MIIKLISIGKIKSTFIKEGEEEYLKRLTGSPMKIERVEVSAEQFTNNEIEPGLEREAKRVLDRIKKEDFLVILDEHGKTFTSPGLANLIQQQMNSGRKSIVFAIGGAYGWHKLIFERANMVLSLSEMTFPFQLVRLILIEQLYRAHTIINGIPYHKA